MGLEEDKEEGGEGRGLFLTATGEPAGLPVGVPGTGGSGLDDILPPTNVAINVAHQYTNSYLRMRKMG